VPAQFQSVIKKGFSALPVQVARPSPRWVRKYYDAVEGPSQVGPLVPVGHERAADPGAPGRLKSTTEALALPEIIPPVEKTVVVVILKLSQGASDAGLTR
jgi:hypothetical protein